MTKFVLLFPGQGSQSLGMMGAYGEQSVIRDTFAEASDLLHVDLWRMVSEGPAEELHLTVNTQPVMLVAGVACYRLWRSMGGSQPAFMAGHSLGEYTALTCAGALEFADALRLVRLRAEAMQSAVPEGQGGMAAILGMDDDAVRALCVEAAGDEVLAAVNFNSPGQVVIAGHRPAVERAMALAKERGAKRALPLPVSVPSHCELMQPAADKLSQALASVCIKSPTVRVIHNVDVAEHTEAGAIRDALVRQLCQPVRWVETIRFMGSAGIGQFVECGPGKVLTGLNKRILPEAAALAMTDAASMAQALEQTVN